MAGSIGAVIKRLRREQNVTQEELAHALNITNQSISKWENGVSSPDVSYIPLLSEFFSVPIAELFIWDAAPAEETAAEDTAGRTHEEIADKKDLGRRLDQTEINDRFAHALKKKAVGNKVVIADDAGFMRSTICHILESSGLHVIATAENGFEALEAVCTLSVDAVFLDVVMPGMDGMDVARTIHKARPAMPIIFCSALTYDHFVDRALDAGVSAFIAKPFTAKTLVDSIRDLFNWE